MGGEYTMGMETVGILTTGEKETLIDKICESFNAEFTKIINRLNNTIYQMDNGVLVSQYLTMDELLIDWKDTLIGDNYDGNWDNDILAIVKIEYERKNNVLL